MMIRRIAIGFALLGIVVPASGQMRDFGEVQATTRESFEAGIEGLRVVRFGPEDKIHECLITVDVLAEGGRTMGVSEIRFPGEDLVEQAYVSAVGESFHARVNEATGTVSFEHVGGDSFTVSRPPRCGVPEEFPRTKEAYEEVIRERRKCSEQVEITGTSKTFLEALADNKESMDLMITVLGEIRDFFDVPTKGLREARRRASEQVLPLSSGISTATSGASMPTSSLDLCGPGTEQFCNFNFPIDLGGFGDCFFCNKSKCCTEASQEADIDCGRVTPGIGCCANSLCQVTSPTCGAFCACGVIGYPFDCRGTCV